MCSQHGKVGLHSVSYESENATVTQYQLSKLVRPDTAYPPFQSTPEQTAFSLELDLGKEGVLSVNVTTKSLLANGAPSYIRWSGVMEGRVGGEELKGGYALYEQFKKVAE